MINDPRNAPTHALESSCWPLRRPRTPAASSMDRTIPAEVHTPAMTAADRPAPSDPAEQRRGQRNRRANENRQLAQHGCRHPAGGQPDA